MQSNYACLVFVVLVLLMGCARHAGPGEMQSLDEATAAMTSYCDARYHAGLIRARAVDDLTVGAYRNGDEHLLLGNCDGHAEQAGFFYDRRLHRAFTWDGWHHETPCREWDPDRTSIFCSKHPNS